VFFYRYPRADTSISFNPQAKHNHQRPGPVIMGQIYRLFLDSSDSDTSSTSSSSSSSSSPRAKVYGCVECGTHLSTNESVISKTFQGHHGRAWLFHRAVNILEGAAEERNMTTGLHVVKDIVCAHCQAVVGWKYEKAYEPSQKYKEGKYILERALLCEVP